MKTKSYLMSTGEENIEVGKTYYFGESTKTYLRKNKEDP